MAKVGAVILAAGSSSRFGKPKQLVPFQGQTLLERAVSAAIKGGCTPVIVVTGSDAADVAVAISAARSIVVENYEWAEGVGTSIRAGMQRLIDVAPEVEAAVLLVCDQPFVSGETVAILQQRWRETGKAIVASRYSNTLGVPALFSNVCFQDLLSLQKDTGAKPIILANRERVAEVPFPEGAFDIDTIRDYQELTSR